MKIRMIAIALTLTLAAWLPLAAQQSAPAQPAAQQAAPTGDSGNGCACCQHMKDGQASKNMSCCEGKDMDCCKKGGKGSQSAMNCCTGKDAKQCCGKDGQLCAKKDGKGCCGDQSAANNTKDAKHCCGGHQNCCHGSSQS